MEKNNMERYFIYKYSGYDRDLGKNVEFLMYYRKALEKIPEKMVLAGVCTVDPLHYFICPEGHTKSIEEGKPYTRKDIATEAISARNAGNNRLSGMLEHLIQLKYSWIPQIIKNCLVPNPGGHFFPHKSKPIQYGIIQRPSTDTTSKD